MANAILTIVLLTALWIWSRLVPEERVQELIEEEIYTGLKDGSIDASMKRK